jgi:transposase
MRALLELGAWLKSEGCTAVAMEATGVYWKPVWHVLEGYELAQVLANPMHVKNVPGRKTDINDATWLADLMAHGLIRGSFVPPRPIAELRELTRTRKQLMRERARHVQRISKTLEDANIKVQAMISDIMGKSGRRFLEAIVEGEADPERLAALRDTRLRRASEAELVEALRGNVQPVHRLMIKLHLEQIASIDGAIAAIEDDVGRRLEASREVVENLTTIPGVSQTTARTLIAEIGCDMTRFPTVRHLISWAGLCPRNDESAGKRRSTNTRKSAPWLKVALTEAAWAATNKRGSYLRAQYHRLKARRGPKKAVVAVAASILTAAFFIIRDGVPYRDLGPDHFDRTDATKTIGRLVRRLKDLGCEVAVTPRAAATSSSAPAQPPTEAGS